MKKVIIFNVGSSTCKFQIFTSELELLGKGLVDKVGIDGTNVSYKDKDGNEYNDERNISFDELDEYITDFLQEKEIINFEDVYLMVHRVVNGGDVYPDNILLNSIYEVGKLEGLNHLAPLHNPYNCKMLRSMFERYPNSKQAIVFDTSFHSTIEPENFIYAIPYKYYDLHKIRKYGAHGSSHAFITETIEKKLGKKVNIINVHLGNGASVCVTKDSKSVNTSMGLTPLGGLVMGTRSGDVDPSVVLYLINKLGISGEEVERILLKESGLLGLSGISSDMRDVIISEEIGNDRAILARNISAKRIAQTISSYLCEVDHVDAITLTGGIGENDFLYIRKIFDRLPNLKIHLKDEFNNKEDVNKISDNQSQIPVYIVPTNEELYMAKVGKRLIGEVA